MLTNIRIKNFKRLVDVDMELGQSVVLIGPNNSGKTTALQALALWDIGRRRWSEKRGSTPGRLTTKKLPTKRPGVTINRNDLLAIPIPVANLLWRNLHVRDVERSAGKPVTSNVLIDIIVEGVTNGKSWTCGFEFDYANEESFYCRPLRLADGKQPPRMPVPDEAADVKVAFLPPMSGLAAVEPKLEPGRVNVLIGEGQTAQVLRNLCFGIFSRAKGIGELDNAIVARDRGRKTGHALPEGLDDWDALVEHIRRLFGVTILPPSYIKERGEVAMAYREQSGVELDLSCSGRGLQQTLLLLAHLYANPHTVLLLDEPDAHLEILRQRQTYELLTETARRQGSQVIAASHSEVVLDEAADKDVVIAFVGTKPHRIDDRGSQLLKSLKDIGYEHHYLAEEKGWVLYLEGSTDLAILQALARTMGHPAADVLERPFVHYVGNRPQAARNHFRGLAEACRSLRGIAVYDFLEDETLSAAPPLVETMWRRREIENYLCTEEVLLAFARGEEAADLFSKAEGERRVEVMRQSIGEMVTALKKMRKPSPWSQSIKASDDFLDPLFENFYEKLALRNQMRKTNYHVLARFVLKENIDPEVVEKLDAIVEVAKQAKPAVE